MRYRILFDLLLLARYLSFAVLLLSFGILLGSCGRTEIWYIACEDSLHPFANTWKSTIEARFPNILVKFRFGNAAFLCQQVRLNVPMEILILPEPAWLAKMAIRNNVILLDSAAIGIVCFSEKKPPKTFILPSDDQSLYLSLKNNQLKSYLPQNFVVNTGDLIPKELRAGIGQCAFLYDFQAAYYQLPFKQLTSKTTPIVLVTLHENPKLQTFFQSLSEKKLLLR